MALLKQKTVSVGNQSQRVGLKKLSNDMARGGRHKYEIVDLDTGDLFEGPYTDKRDGEKAFRRITEDLERGMESNANSNDAPDFGIGSESDLLDPFDDGLL